MTCYLLEIIAIGAAMVSKAAPHFLGKKEREHEGEKEEN